MTIIAAGAIRPVADTSASGRRPDTAGSGFMIPAAALASGQEASRLTSGLSSTLAAGAMLALQEQAGLDGETAAALADREARRHAQDILEALAALQKALLAGGSPSESLAHLTALAGMTPPLHDPALARILSSIRLRAQLEILRLAPRRAEQKRLPETPDGSGS